MRCAWYKQKKINKIQEQLLNSMFQQKPKSIQLKTISYFMFFSTSSAQVCVYSLLYNRLRSKL